MKFLSQRFKWNRKSFFLIYIVFPVISTYPPPPSPPSLSLLLLYWDTILSLVYVTAVFSLAPSLPEGMCEANDACRVDHKRKFAPLIKTHHLKIYVPKWYTCKPAMESVHPVRLSIVQRAANGKELMSGELSDVYTFLFFTVMGCYWDRKSTRLNSSHL